MTQINELRGTNYQIVKDRFQLLATEEPAEITRQMLFPRGASGQLSATELPTARPVESRILAAS
jgi:hypothetical protein